MADDPDFAYALKSASLRVTQPRLAVMRAVRRHAHADTEAIIDAARQRVPDISRQTVYDALNALTAAGLIRRIQPAGSLARYESRIGDNHHHIVCRSCGLIADVDGAIGEVKCLTAPDDRGFEVDEAEVIYWGLCSECSPSHATRSHP